MATIITNQATLNYKYGRTSVSTVSNVTSATIGGSFEIEKTSLNSNYRIGQNLTYIVSFNNNGPALENITVSDDLGSYQFNNITLTPLNFVGPAQLFINGVFSENLTPIFIDNGISFFIDNLPTNANAQIIYQAVPNEFADSGCQSEITNTVTAQCECPCNTPATASHTISGECYADVRIAKSICPNPIICGEAVTYVFDISNYGNIPATDVVLTDTFTPPLTNLIVTLNGVELSQPDYSYNNGVLTIPGEDSTLDLTVPAATSNQNPNTGEYTVIPGKIQIIVKGNL